MVRFSFSHTNTYEEVKEAINAIKDIVKNLYEVVYMQFLTKKRIIVFLGIIAGLGAALCF